MKTDMWHSTLRLGLVLSVIVAVAAALLVGRISDQALIGGSFLVASVLGWANVQRFCQPRRATVRVTRR